MLYYVYFDDFKYFTYSEDKLNEIKEDWSEYIYMSENSYLEKFVSYHL